MNRESNEIESVSVGKDIEPITETQPPLVIDLPEGQKLVVGKLDPETVIEVATWRGTGRPDSRTNRLMLGVSSNSTRTIENQIEIEAHASTEPIRTGHQYSYANEPTTTEEIKQLKMEKNMKKKSKWKLLLSSALALALISLALGPIGMRFAHPTEGIGTKLGSAKSSIAIVIPIKNPKVGTNVITEVINKENVLVLGSISVASNDDLLISTDRKSFQIKTSNLHGKVVAVLPFFGLVANLFNK